MPAVRAIGITAQTNLGLEWRSGAEGFDDGVADTLDVVGVSRPDAEVAAVDRAKAGVGRPHLVAVKYLSVGAGGPNAQGHGVDQSSHAFLGPLLVGFSLALSQERSLLFDLGLL